MAISFSCCGITYRQRRNSLDARIPQNQISSVYDKIAPIYDLWGRLTETRARNRALELAKIQDGQTILEVAVGTGLAFYEIVKRNPNGTNIGIDISPGMLAKAKQRLRQLPATDYSLDLGSAFKLNYPNESIDTLVNNYMFDLISYEDTERILPEFRRVLKKDGKLVLVNMTQGERLGSGIYDTIYTISPETMGGCRGVRMSETLQKQSFTVAVREYYQQMLFPSEVILAYK